MVKCMRYGVTYNTEDPDPEGIDNIRALGRDTVIVEDAFDQLGRPGVKIVYVDTGSCFSKRNTALQHIDTIRFAEERKAIADGTPCPRLIFFQQDRDYWPSSEGDPDAMARRAAKEKACKGSRAKPDFREIYVPPAKDEALRAWPDEEETSFIRYFDPLLPGTKFIIDNLDPLYRWSFDMHLSGNPDLKEMLSPLLDDASASKPVVSLDSTGHCTKGGQYTDGGSNIRFYF